MGNSDHGATYMRRHTLDPVCGRIVNIIIKNYCIFRLWSRWGTNGKGDDASEQAYPAPCTLHPHPPLRNSIPKTRTAFARSSHVLTKRGDTDRI